MKKELLLAVPLLLLLSCTVQKPLYSWSNYQTTSYNYLKNNQDKDLQELLDSYKKIIEKQEGTRNVPPPGVCADYGYLLIMKGKTAEGKTLLKKEVELYPESKIFIDRILKLIDNEKTN
jgi:hypothetical protein